MNIKLTCFVSCYNEKLTIHDVLESLRNQECSFYYRVVVYDDASTDGSQGIIKNFCEKYPNFSYVFRKKIVV